MYKATLNVTESMGENYQEPTGCVLNEVISIPGTFFAAPNSLQLNFTCFLYLHTIYNGSLVLIINDDKEEIQLENEDNESLLTFSE